MYVDNTHVVPFCLYANTQSDVRVCFGMEGPTPGNVKG